MTRIEVFYQGEGIKGIETIEVDGDQTIGSVKEAILKKHGGQSPTAAIFVEDAENAADEHKTIRTVAGSSGAKVHIHRCRRIDVAVTFAGDTVQNGFGPGTTVATVKRWAGNQFKMTKEDAGEHVLQLAGTHERPSSATHIGSLTSHPTCRLAFDLVPDERVNGASLS